MGGVVHLRKIFSGPNNRTSEGAMTCESRWVRKMCLAFNAISGGILAIASRCQLPQTSVHLYTRLLCVAFKLDARRNTMARL